MPVSGPVPSGPALEPCPGCGALFPPGPGATHRYIGASPGCWAVYTPMVVGLAPAAEVLAASRVPPVVAPNDALGDVPNGTADAAPAGALRPLLVDAYAAQHPGVPSPQAVQSVAVHLLVLHGVLARGAPVADALRIRLRAVRTPGVFAWLAPPLPGEAGTRWWTVRHLFPGGGVARPVGVDAYVRSVYACWAARHEATVAAWYDRHVLGA